jgi:hypothetical protein
MRHFPRILESMQARRLLTIVLLKTPLVLLAGLVGGPQAPVSIGAA